MHGQQDIKIYYFEFNFFFSAFAKRFGL